MIVLFFVAAFRYLAGMTLDAAALTRPFYDPATFSWAKVSTGTALAVLTYIGFDGISTLSEEAKNPRRNILLATVLVCLFTGILGSAPGLPGAAGLARLVELPGRRHRLRARGGPRRRAGALRASSTSRCWSPTSAPGWARTSARAACSTAWAATTRSRAAFSASWNPRTHVPSNNVLLVGRSRSPAPSP